MTRITNDLFEAIRKVTAGQQEPQLLNENAEEKVEEGQVDKAHYCATHVEHPIFGDGECIAEAHADPDADGNVEWYTVKFSDGIRKVYTEAMKVKKAKMHEHAEVAADVVAEVETQVDEAQTSAAARLVKAKMSHQAKTTMKHVKNPTAGEKKAAKDIKPGIAGYSDRVAMLKSAEKEGRLKEGMDPVGKEDEDINNDGKNDKSDSYLHNRRKAIKRAMVKESIVIVTEQEIEVEIPSELTFADYLDAVKYLANDDPTISEADIIKMATLAHKENDVDVILEAAYNRTREGDKMYSPELDADIDRSKPGVTRVSRRIKPGEGMGTKQSERKLMKRIASRNK